MIINLFASISTTGAICSIKIELLNSDNSKFKQFEFGTLLNKSTDC